MRQTFERYAPPGSRVRLHWRTGYGPGLECDVLEYSDEIVVVRAKDKPNGAHGDTYVVPFASVSSIVPVGHREVAALETDNGPGGISWEIQALGATPESAPVYLGSASSREQAMSRFGASLFATLEEWERNGGEASVLRYEDGRDSFRRL